MTWTRTSSRVLPIAPAALWDVLADVERWPHWDPDLDRVVLRGPLATGAAGFFYPSGKIRGRIHAWAADDFTVAVCEPPRELVLRQPVPGGRMDHGFVLVPVEGGTELRQRITVDSPLRAVMVRVIAGDLVAHFDRKCDVLARLAAAPTG